MNVEEAAAKYRPVSLKALKRMVDEGLLSEPLNEGDQHALSVLSQFMVGRMVCGPDEHVVQTQQESADARLSRISAR